MSKRPDPEERVSDEQLLADFLAGHEDAFTSLVGRYSHELFQFVARFVRNAAVAEDVVQESFIQVHQSGAGFDPQRRFRPWLFTIAANKARDHLRGRSRKREVSLSFNQGASESNEELNYLHFLSGEDEAPDRRLEQAEEQEIVKRIVSKMPDHLREVLVLGYYQRMPYKEIAEVLNIPLGTVKSRLHAAVNHFAEVYRREVERGSDGTTKR